MRATFALLGNREVYNLVRKLAWDIHLKYRTGTRHCRLPPHISLKQPFTIPEIAPQENYMDELAAGSCLDCYAALASKERLHTLISDIIMPYRHH